MLDEPHDPACHDCSTDKQGEAERAEAQHHFGLGALGDGEDDRGAEGEQECGAELRELHLGGLSSAGQRVRIDRSNEVQESTGDEVLGAVIVQRGGCRGGAEEAGTLDVLLAVRPQGAIKGE